MKTDVDQLAAEVDQLVPDIETGDAAGILQQLMRAAAELHVMVCVPTARAVALNKAASVSALALRAARLVKE